MDSSLFIHNISLVKKLLKVSKKNINVGNKVKIKFVKDRPGHDLRYAIDSDKIRKSLNWKPKFTFSTGIEKTFLWYTNNQKYYSSINKKDIVERLGLRK